jgi:hypothetical protein
MGHCGRLPIRLGWFAIVLPALTLNYFGQGALLLTDPRAIENPFYLLSPDWLHYPMVAFATFATIVASQAVISGAYSLTQQAIQLGFLRRLRVLHTASHERGQISIGRAPIIYPSCLRTAHWAASIESSTVSIRVRTARRFIRTRPPGALAARGKSRRLEGYR